MKCKVCGADSGNYPLCRLCNNKKEQGLIIKCEKCGYWHYKNADCIQEIADKINENEFKYESKYSILTKSEQSFFCVIKNSIPEGFVVFPQVNLATFISPLDNQRYHNELFRNVDFLICTNEYNPKIVIEINDKTHLNSYRYQRDIKVQNILEEAGIPILKLWTSYGADKEYITKRINDLLNNPVERKHHFVVTEEPEEQTKSDNHTETIYKAKKRKGCYIATCVYGSYDCPQVWTLRRYRDFSLSSSILGRTFIKIYYVISPHIVHIFKNNRTFCKIVRALLDRKVKQLNQKGYNNEPYND